MVPVVSMASAALPGRSAAETGAEHDQKDDQRPGAEDVGVEQRNSQQGGVPIEQRENGIVEENPA